MFFFTILAGKIAIVASDSDGSIIAMHLHKELWKVRLADILKEKVSTLMLLYSTGILGSAHITLYRR